jgi:hypothetical protein
MRFRRGQFGEDGAKQVGVFSDKGQCLLGFRKALSSSLVSPVAEKGQKKHESEKHDGSDPAFGDSQPNVGAATIQFQSFPAAPPDRPYIKRGKGERSCKRKTMGDCSLDGL